MALPHRLVDRPELASRRWAFKPQRRRIAVAELAAGQPDEHPHTRDLIWRIELLPEPPGAPQRRERGPSVALAELDDSTNVRSHCVEHRAAAAGSDLLELFGGAARFVAFFGG